MDHDQDRNSGALADKRRQSAELNLQLRRTQAILDGTNAGTWEWNAQTDAFRHDDRWGEILGYERAELDEVQTGEHWDKLTHPDDLAEAEARLAACLQGETRRYQTSLRVRHKDGHWVWVLETGRIFTRTADGRPEWLYGTQIDVSELKHQERRAMQARDRLESIAECTSVGIIALTHDGVIDFLSAGFTELLGYTADQLADRETWISAVSVDHLTRFLLHTVLGNSGAPAEADIRIANEGLKIRDAKGRVRAMLLSRVCSAAGPVLTFADVTRQRHQEEYIQFIARHDGLTGLPNRALLTERLDWQVIQTRRSHWTLCIAFLDLDGFKVVNDSYGHEAGDQVLKTTASRLKGAVREIDTVARLGGDEYVIVLTELESRAESLALIERILEAVRAPMPFEGQLLQVSGSIGVTFYSQGRDTNGDQLLRQADKAMYDAKAAGKDRYAVFDHAMDRSVREHRRSLDSIAQALNCAEFELHFQPKVAVRTGRLLGVEALLRWRQADGQLVTPDQFLPTLGDHDLSMQVGSWVLARAIADLDRLLTDGHELTMSINIFPRQILSKSFVAELRELLTRHPRILAPLVELEVVETAVLNELDSAGQVMHACRDLGVRFALDDFGTGFSSLSHLKYLPVSTLKIDKSFVTDMLNDPDDLAIVRGSLSLAHAFGLEVVAEGVESDGQIRLLRELECDQVQGYALGRPMPFDDLKTFIEARDTSAVLFTGETTGTRSDAAGAMTP